MLDNMEKEINLKSKKNDAGRYGYVNDAGKWVIPAAYDEAYEFMEGLACVMLDGKCGFIKPDGTWAIPPVYEETDWQCSEGLIWFVELRGSKCGYLNREGLVAIAPLFEEANFFCNGVAVVKFNGRYGVIDHAGKWIVNPTFDEVSPSFMNGTATAELNGAFGVLRPDGSWLIPLTDSELTLCPPKNVNGEWSLRDSEGNVVKKICF